MNLKDVEIRTQTGRKKYAHIPFEIESNLRAYKREEVELILVDDKDVKSREEDVKWVEDVVYEEIQGESWLEVQLWEIFVLVVNGFLSMTKFLFVVLLPLALSGVWFIVKSFLQVVKLILQLVVNRLTKAGNEITNEIVKSEEKYDRRDFDRGGGVVVYNNGNNVNIQINVKN